ncbi:MAG: hypothetical protein Q7L07_04125, partial [Pseudohongiella sp.]|nr:hypothetical protein [Pseudohongiella sp.]
IRTLLLPISERCEAEAVELAKELCNQNGIAPIEIDLFFRKEVSTWKESGKPSRLLKNIVNQLIRINGSEADLLLASNYFELHLAYQGNDFLMTFEQASAFLSHAELIITLAKNNLSASQIANLLSMRDTRVPFTRQTVDKLLGRVRLSEKLNSDKFFELYDQDIQASQVFFADANIAECKEIVAEIGDRFGVDLNWRRSIDILIPDENLIAFVPYLQILHFQCSISEFQDFIITDMYEFNPRGILTNEFLNRYPQAICGAGNPFLNNAKSVERLTPSWVRSKKPGERPGAWALFSILDNLRSMGFSARRELCSWIRMLIHRVILLASEIPTALPQPFTEDMLEHLLASVKAGNTQTYGIVEQRIVDAIANLRHPSADGWKMRGCNDSVNASNISRKKLGDCDFQQLSSKRVVAYEAHGGHLTKLYLEDHLRTLTKVLKHRKAEWETLTSREDWEVELIFVAHSLAEDVNDVNVEIDGTSINVQVTTFEVFLSTYSNDELIEPVNRDLIERISTARIPNAVREKIRTLLVLMT